MDQLNRRTSARDATALITLCVHAVIPVTGGGKTAWAIKAQSTAGLCLLGVGAGAIIVTIYAFYFDSSLIWLPYRSGLRSSRPSAVHEARMIAASRT